MSNENLNNTPNWKQNLDALDSLPGEATYNKSAAWEKLHARLGSKTRRKKSGWYWMAAACITFALVIPLVYSIRNNQRQITSSAKEIQASSETLSTKVEKKDFDPVSNLAVVTNEKKSLAIPGPTEAKMMNRNKEKILSLTYAVSSKNLITEMPLNVTKPIDSLSSLVMIRPEKKKLKVVHINELGDPVETLPEIVRNSDKHTFQFKIASQEIYINPTMASNTNGFTILKIKPSQN